MNVEQRVKLENKLHYKKRTFDEEGNIVSVKEKTETYFKDYRSFLKMFKTKTMTNDINKLKEKAIEMNQNYYFNFGNIDGEYVYYRLTGRNDWKLSQKTFEKNYVYFKDLDITDSLFFVRVIDNIIKEKVEKNYKNGWVVEKFKSIIYLINDFGPDLSDWEYLADKLGYKNYWAKIQYGE
jgi:hypothetical protein